ncbi:hypothetical protein ACNJYD_04365 [Bradyrhizobium sp. DASA03005]|uniref:hypothetical protein n=1 Tax=Bradyrhizobium sp. SPXBL-02 TaxID=3395912 RepID=UPI003F72C2BC
MIIWLAGSAFLLTAAVMHYAFVRVSPLQKKKWLQIDYAANAVAAFAVLVAAADYQYYRTSRQAGEDREAYSRALIATRDAISYSNQYCKDNAHVEKIKSSRTCRLGQAFSADLDRQIPQPDFPFVPLLLFSGDQINLELMVSDIPCISGVFTDEAARDVRVGNWPNYKYVKFCDFYQTLEALRRAAVESRSGAEGLARFKSLSGLWIVLFAIVLGVRLTKVAAEIKALPQTGQSATGS